LKFRLLLLLSGILVLGGCQTQLSEFKPGMADFQSPGSMPSGYTNHHATFKGPYLTITNINYDASFHGATTIAQLRQIMETDGDFEGRAYPIKGVITGLCYFGSSFTSWQLYVQDSTGGIYFWVSGGVSGVTSSSLGQVLTCIVTGAKSYKGLKEVAAVSSPSVTPTGAPSAIYVKDIQDLAGTDDGIVIRATGTVKDVILDDSGAYIVSFNESIPLFYSINGVYTPGQKVTVVGPLCLDAGIPMIDNFQGYPHADTTYSIKW